MGAMSESKEKTYFSVTVEIEAAPDVVWSIMADVERWPDMDIEVSSLKLLTGGQLAVGSRARIHQPRLPRANWRVTQLRPGHSFTWVSVAPGVRVTARHSVAATVGGACVTLSICYEGIFGGWLARWTGDLNERYLALEAEGLKRRCTEMATKPEYHEAH